MRRFREWLEEMETKGGEKFSGTDIGVKRMELERLKKLAKELACEEDEGGRTKSLPEEEPETAQLIERLHKLQQRVETDIQVCNTWVLFLFPFFLYTHFVVFFFK